MVEREEGMNLIQISRVKLNRDRLYQGPGPAWKWLYTVLGVNGEVLLDGTTMLSIARQRAKKAVKEQGASGIQENWISERVLQERAAQ